MDPHTLLQCFAGTLEVAQDVRQNAEKELRQLSHCPGFLGACLDILGASEISPGCRQAAAVYFKNTVVRHWTNPNGRIDAGEKPVLLDRLVSVLAAVDFSTKHQLVPVFRVLVSAEYPSNWPSLLPEIGALLQKHDDVSSMYTGVMCFAEVCRFYRWIENSERESALDPIIAQVFPHLLDVGNAILASEINETTADLLKHILKAYKFVTYFDLPRILQSKDALLAWGDFHCRVISHDPPAYILAPAPDSEKSQTQIAKCYKWSVANIERLFRRYASRDLSSKRKLDSFRQVFVADFIPHVMSIYLSLMERWCKGERWLSSTAVYHLLDFLSHCVTRRKPGRSSSPLFETDPADYINSKLDNFDDSEPDVAALGLLVTLVSKRKKTTAEPIINFAVNQLTELKSQPEDLQVARKKDGALRLVGGISHILTPQSSPYFSQMESFLAEFVLPNLSSKFEFLQARTLDVCSKFSDLALQDGSNISTLYHGILRAFSSDAGDVSLPVTLQSALAIQAYLHHPQFREILSVIILPTMSKLLELSNEIDNESVSVVMQECVENFAPQLQPFGIDLMKNLVAQFLRLASEIKESTSVEIDDFEADYNDAISDKITAALGLLNTMITVLLSFENSKEVCMTLEETFSPAIEYVVVNQLDDFIAEIGELIENSIFLLRAVTPLMWSHFSRLADSFSQGVALMYTEDLSPCLKNYMVFGCNYLAQQPDLVAKFRNIILLIISGDEGMSDYNDIALACELAQTLILSLQHTSPPLIAELSETILPVLVSNQKDSAHISNDTLMINSINYVISCLMYDCPNTLKSLQGYNYLNFFFESWFGLVPQAKRVYDIKLFILGFMRISNSPEASAAVPSLASHIGTSLAALFKELPSALKNLEKQRAEFSENDYRNDDSFGGDFGDFADYDDDADSEAEEGEDSASTDKYRDFLSQESSKLMGSGAFDEEDGVFEDVLGATPLDNVDPVIVFREFSNSLQTNNPALYGAIFDPISESDRQVFIEVFKTT
ncbi:hypothetical protein JCM33374_g2649 [Metschnikowia sp. JCM 33374]|nr:hypothetical protein JCM33374_g2649 [Metschnikowia sp. JCM 33374]